MYILGQRSCLAAIACKHWLCSSSIFAMASQRGISHVNRATGRLDQKRNARCQDGGHVIVGTLGPEGPTRCSGLDVMRYDAEALHDQFGTRFRLVESSKELHRTPFGTTQQFLYCYCRVEEPESSAEPHDDRARRQHR